MEWGKTMKISEITQKLDLKIITQADFKDRDVSGCYIGDLLSLVMSKAQMNNIWITVQTNINIVAVATLTDVSFIVIPEEIVVDEGTIKRANMQDVVIFGSSKNSYEIACDISKLL